MKITDDYVPLIGHYEIWNRGDGIAEVAYIGNRNIIPVIGSIKFFIRGDNQLVIDEKLGYLDTVSAIPGVIDSGELNGQSVESEEHLVELILANYNDSVDKVAIESLKKKLLGMGVITELNINATS